MRDKSMLLTKGPIMKSLIIFSLPILFGNLFQQMYNAVDSLVVGNFVNSAALAAVTSTNNVIFLTVGFLQGVFIGAGVAVARYFGAENDKMLRVSIHTTIVFALCAGIFLSIVGVALSPWLLRILNTPPEVLPLSTAYFRIYYAGLLAPVLYNCATGILQAVGDSRHPLIYLIISSCLNIVLDLIFVIYFGWGVPGVAYATVISQAFSAILAFTHLMRSRANYRVSISYLKCDFSMLKRILRLGIPSGLQNSIVAFSNLVSQSHLNTFGAYAVAGSGTFQRVEGFAFISITSVALATTTYVSQNVGAHQFERAHKAAKYSMLTNAIVGEGLSLCVLFFAPWLIGMFNGESEVIRYGVMHARVAGPWYFLPAITHTLAGVLRGMGRPLTPMAVLLVCWCVVRVSYLTIVLNIWHEIRLLYAVYPMTWFLSATVLLICYSRIKWDNPDK